MKKHTMPKPGKSNPTLPLISYITLQYGEVSFETTPRNERRTLFLVAADTRFDTYENSAQIGWIKTIKQP